MLAIHPILSLGRQGPDIADLHEALNHLGFGDQIPAADLEAQHYGEATAAVVRQVQHQFGIQTEQHGTVDEVTAETINRTLFEQGVFRIVQGQVTHPDGGPVVGNLLFAFDRDNIGGAYLGSAHTNADGFYHMFYDPRRYAHPGEGVLRVKDVIDLVIQVYDAAGTTLAESEPLHDPDRRVEVNLRLGDRPGGDAFVVRGHVVSTAGPVNGVRVSVYDRDLFFRRDESQEQWLGTEVTHPKPATNEDGWFEIVYRETTFAPGDLAQNGRRTPDLIFSLNRDDQPLEPFQIVRLPDGDVLTQEDFVSPDDLILGLQARTVEEVRILIADGEPRREPSEYERLWRGIDPLLPERGDGAAQREAMVCAAAERLDEARHRDVSFVARETGLDRDLVALFAAACRLTAGPFNHTVPPVVFYGLARSRRNLTGLPALALAKAADLTEGLAEAMSDNRIPFLDEAMVQAGIETILHLAPQAMLTHVPLDGQPAFGERLAVALPDANEQSVLLRTFADHSDNPVQFWEQLRARPEFAESGKIERAQVALQLDALTQSHVPLMQSLQAEHGLTSTRALLDLGEDKLRELLQRPEVGLPSAVPGDTPEQQMDTYVGSILGALHLALPTESVAKALREAPASHVGDEATQAALNTFFSITTDETLPADARFDLRSTNIEAYVAQHAETAFENAPADVRSKTVAQLKRAQRLFRVSTAPHTFTALVGTGLDSARDIAAIPQQTFLAEFKDSLGEQEAEMVHARATAISTSSLQLYVMLNDALHGVYPDAVKRGNAGTLSGPHTMRDVNAPPGIQEAVARHIPNWQELFGAPEVCECGHCHSVYSPAAYFVDLLQFLEKSGRNARGLSPLDILIGKTADAPGEPFVMGRRPDLAHLKLTCENTNTTLPYVDLVNEVLESLAIAYATANEEQGRLQVDYDRIAAYDTGDATPPELKANPQYTNLAAYHTPDQPDARARVDRVAYPITLPYDHALETARVYLGHLGAGLGMLLEQFGDAGNDAWHAAETLGLAPAEYELLTGKTRDGSDAEIDTRADALYGFTPELLPSLKVGATGPFVALLKHRLNTSGEALPLDPDPSAETFDEETETAVRALQQAQGLAEDGTVHIGEWRALAPLAPSAAEAMLPNVRTFLHRTGISYEELLGLLEMRFVNPARDAFEVLLRLRLPADDLLAFIEAGLQDPSDGLRAALAEANVEPDAFTAWAEAHLSGEAWTRLKASLVVEAPPDEACALDRMRLRRWDPAQPDLDEATWHRPNRLIRLWRRLGWSLSELDRVLVALQANDLTPGVLAHLALVHTAHQKLDLSVDQIVALWATLDPTRTGSFYHNLFLSRAALRIDPAFAPDWKGEVLAGAILRDHVPALLAGLRLKADEVAAVLPDENADLTLEALSTLVRHTVLARALGMRVKELAGLADLAGLDPFVPPTQDWPLLRFTALAQRLQEADLPLALLDYLVRGGMNASPVALQENVGQRVFEEVNTGLKQIDEEFALTDDPQGEVPREHLSILQAARQHSFIKQKLADALGAEAPLIARLIDRDEDGGILLHRLDDDAQPLIQDMLPPADFAHAADAYLRLHKAVLLINTFGLSETEAALLAGALIDFNHPTFEAVRQLAHYAALKKQLPGSQTPLAAVFAAADRDAALTALGDATRWPNDVLDDLTGPQGFGWELADLHNPENLARLQEGLRLLSRLGIAAPQAFAWARRPIDTEQAEAVKRVTRAKYEDAAWLDVAKSLSDRLRERQKNALIAYLLPRLGIETSDQLYEHLLIDVDMSACMMTSRIKQAISSVQLFVQRCLMNLEPHVPAPAIDSRQWEWMQRYRIWEANRKVFLYPENWIEPELRDDKTPFFKELESELLQTDVTNASVEQAFLNYLGKLDAVARLQMCGLFVQSDFEAREKKKEVVHVFGRTPNQPQSYYYRQYVVTTNDVTYWTPWEKVPVDVRGHQIVPVVWNRRLYLFWPLVTTKTGEPPTGSDKPQQGEPYDVVQLAWSEYRDGKWSPKYVTPPEQAVRVDGNDARLEAYGWGSRLVLRYQQADTRLRSYAPGYNINLNTVTPARTVAELEEKGSARFVLDDCHGELKPQAQTWTTRHLRGYTLGSTSIQPLGENQTKALTTLGAYYEGNRLTEQQLRHQTHDYFFFEDNQRAYFVRFEAEGGGFFDEMYDKDFARPYLKVHEEMAAHPYAVEADLGRPYFAHMAQATAISHPWTSATARLASLSLQPQAAALNANGYQDAVAIPLDKGALSLVGDYAAYAREPYAMLTYETFYHPFACDFTKRVARYGVAGLLTLDSQKLTSGSPFESRYKPNPGHVAKPYPVERVDFGETGNPAAYRVTAYSTYNWELFFHVPMLVATRLSQNQRFEEALRWLQYVFNPTDGNGDYWKVLPFRTTPRQHIEALLEALNAKGGALTKQLAEWRDYPFQPHLIARMRLGAYQKYVVMKTVEIGLACGDYYFRQDTIESINIAAQYYVWCANLLGPYPEKMPVRRRSQPRTFAELRKSLDAFSNAMVGFENAFPLYSGTSLAPAQAPVGLLGIRRAFYFCIPQNDRLLGYWDLVRDRLFKIRHCMNIEGIVRALPLFEPPIDPALLVQAAARGISLGSVLNDLSTPLSPYRFSYLLQKALEVCNDLKALGGALLATLEKRDGEKLALLRQQHEKAILDLVKDVREKQIDEAEASVEALKKSRAQAAGRYLHYQELLGAETLTTPEPGEEIQMVSARKTTTSEGGAHLIQEEKSELDAAHSARDWQVRASMTETLASLSHYIPSLTIETAPWGVGSSLKIPIGGEHVGPALSAIARYQKGLGEEDAYRATHAGKMAIYARREQEWALQSNLAAREIMQIDAQLLAADLRVRIAQQEATNHERQIQNAEAVEAFLNTKYTNEDLYGWMEGKIGELYFQGYQVASDLAKKAEQAYRFERGLTTSSFIKFGAWDSLRKGLLAGEQLALQLRQLDRAYHDQNRREYEITKHVSLVQLDPLALIALKQTGTCTFDLPETLFDVDFPGHYFRRVKSVSVSIPCVVGPYTSVCGTLTLLNNRIRTRSLAGNGYAEQLDDDRFLRDFVPLQSIATSNGQSDSGLFELNFRDERYLPFEGGGVISRWRFELPATFRPFDYDSIADVVLHLRYTARDGGEPLREQANEALKSVVKAEGQTWLTRAFSLRHEFPSEWQRFRTAARPDGAHEQAFSLSKDRFPFLFQNNKLTIYQVDLFAVPGAESPNAGPDPDKLALIAPGSELVALSEGETIGRLAHRTGNVTVTVNHESEQARWSLRVEQDDVAGTLGPLEDVLLLCHYTVGGQQP